MPKTDLPVGSYIRYRFRGGIEFARIEEHGILTPLDESEIEKGTEVHHVVWRDRDTRIEARSKFRKR